MRAERIARILVAGLSITGTTEALALRCGQAVVTEGDHRWEVERACGAPEAAERRVTYPYRFQVGGRPGAVDVLDIPVIVDEWIYERGPGRFPTLLRFENGRLIRIETLDKP